MDELFCDGMLFPKTIISDTIAKVKHIFEEHSLVVRVVKPSMKKEYWFVKLCENSSPSLVQVKARVLTVMSDLRNQLIKLNVSSNVHLS